jgi:hypothetical protein
MLVAHQVQNKFMKHHRKLLEIVSVLLAVVLLGNGCMMTNELWKDRSFHPRARPDLKLSVSAERPLLLVEYTEQFEKTKHLRRRAFWLDLEDHYDPYSKPAFVDAGNFSGLTPVTVLDVTRGTNSISTNGYVAVETPKQPGFDLWLNGNSVGRYVLPNYLGDAPVNADTVAKTPLTLLADGAVVIVVVGVIALVVAGYLVSEAKE